MTKSFWDNASFLQTKPKYDGKGKRELLLEYFKDQSLGEAKKPVAVLAYDVEKRKPRLLSSYESPGIKMVSAASATSAAPIYYSTQEIDDGSWLLMEVLWLTTHLCLDIQRLRNYFLDAR